MFYFTETTMKSWQVGLDIYSKAEGLQNCTTTAIQKKIQRSEEDGFSGSSNPIT